MPWLSRIHRGGNDTSSGTAFADNITAHRADLLQGRGGNDILTGGDGQSSRRRLRPSRLEQRDGSDLMEGEDGTEWWSERQWRQRRYVSVSANGARVSFQRPIWFPSRLDIAGAAADLT